ncbi:MAG: hypothetical protein WEB13_01040 [Dehalococcoidia bacterium]
MPVEFILGRSDHRVVARQIARDPEHVAGIVLDPRFIGFQEIAVEAARAQKVTVYVEPMTERLVGGAASRTGLPYAADPIDVALLSSWDARAALVHAVLGYQIGTATVLTPPNFFVEAPESLRLNVALFGVAAQEYDEPLRAQLSVHRLLFVRPGFARSLAKAYRRAGARDLELRISPFGGERVHDQQIQSVFSALSQLREEGLGVTLAYQGMIGETAEALNLVQSYSTGIGLNTRYDFKGQLRRLAAPPKPRDGAKPMGPIAWVLLPGAGILVPRKVAQTLYADRSIRAELACFVDTCDGIAGPVTHPREHYLHSRIDYERELVRLPNEWRAEQERNRLTRYIDLRRRLRRGHLPDGTRPMSTETPEALLSYIERFALAA